MLWVGFRRKEGESEVVVFPTQGAESPFVDLRIRHI